MIQLIKTFPLLPTAATIVIFLLDLLIPLGINFWIFYLIPFLLIYQSYRSRFLIAMAGFTSALALAGFFLSPAGLDPFSEAINRTIGVGVLWMSVALLMKLEKSETERRIFQEKTQAAGRQVEEILEKIGDAFVALDKDWRYVYMNKKAGEIFGRDPKQMIGKHIWTEFPEGVGQPFHRAYEKAMAEQQFQSLEEYYPPYDQWFENRIYPSEEGLSIFFSDITDRKRGEQELRQRTHFVEGILKAEPGTVYIYDLKEQRNVFVNKEWFAALGYSPEETQRDGFLARTIHEEDLPRILNHHEEWKTIRGQKTREIEYRARTKQGEWRWLQSHEVPYARNEAGAVVQILGIAHDITGQKLADITRQEAMEKLQKQEELLRLVLQHLPVGVWVTDAKGTILTGNEASRKIWRGVRYVGIGGYGEYKGWWADSGKLIEPEEWALARAIQKGETSLDEVIEIECFDGTRKTILNSALPIRGTDGDITGAIVVNQDITERKRAESALKASEERLRLVLDGLGSQMFVGLLDPAGVILAANRPALEAAGLRLEDVLGKPVYETYWFTYSDDVARRFHAAVQRSTQGETVRYDEQIRVAEGRLIWVAFTLQPVRDESGTIAFVVPSAMVIQERKQAEEALQAHHQLLETVVNHVPAAVSLLRGSDLRLQLLNPAYQAIAPGKEMLGKTWDELWAETGQNFTAICRKVLETGEPHHVVDELNMIQRSPDEPSGPAYFSWSLHRVKLPGNDGWGLLGTAWETTSRKQVEQEIERSREQLRALTNHLQTVIEEERARIAHEIHDDIGQLLTATKMNLSLLGRMIGEMKEKKIQKVLEMEIEALVKLLDEGVYSIRKIVRALRPEVLETLGLLAGVEWQAKEFEKRSGVQVSLSLPKELSKISSTHTTALFRAVQEGLTNIARHSQATKAIITLKIIAGAVNLRIQDNGRGISKEQLKRSGSFGLLAMRERVTALGGTLTIEGTPGEGTMVEVAFPLS